ncbi:MAG: hypothetical protein JWO44_589 [Bacteroidetes bacterium]|nr:hypothetical protein [Bacteroidota bacterium]
MKRAIFIAMGLLCLFAGSILAQAPPVNPNAPVMTFQSRVYDYGTLPHSGNGNCEFKFTNTGKEPLIISNVVGSCGCIVPSYPKEPIKPGASAVIRVRYDTGRVGAFEKTLTITSNASEPSIVIKVKGRVLPPVQIDSVIVAPPVPK